MRPARPLAILSAGAALLAGLAVGPAAAQGDAGDGVSGNVAPSVEETYSCDDGRKLDVLFDNARDYSIAEVSQDDGPMVPLVQVLSGSGVRYSNGELTLHTKGDQAVLFEGDQTTSCQAD
jgi:membrane-bound inhibitor of C-type lysozyme